ncbi:hypothetical protein C3K47_01475 [Solitalea longa]|uniref:Uncharacterized protein n=1 Tax=Solitalea longa TaxID=2079460 RepID=A0A2S5A9K7_9SPHI|nr:hypothetical protein [Solitalea longa]POY39194.1 hypothetical protein C3K47_01475 [Solitalea longa]
MKHTYKLFAILALPFLINSCEKEAPPCSGNCASLRVDGNVINKLDSTVASGVTVILSWSKSVYISQDQVISKVNSKKDGTFNFTSNIDTTYFSRGYFLTLRVSSNNEYSILGYSGLINTEAYFFDPNAFQNIHFEVYKKAKLKLKLHRSRNDSIQSFSISHSDILPDFFIYDYNVVYPQEGEINVSTVADVFTKIRVIKTLINGVTTTTIDSIKCLSNSTLVYDINF